MKINWGTKLVIGMICFMGFILYFVITVTTNKKYDYDLVTENYYEKEMYYQEEIDSEQNLNKLSKSITGKKTADGWLLSFPKEINTTNSKGTVFLYRPSDQNLDFDFPLVPSNSNLLIPDNLLLDGRWNITIQWEYNGEPYLYKESIMY